MSAMRKMLVCLPLALLLLAKPATPQSSTPPDQTRTGLWLYHACQASIRVSDAISYDVLPTEVIRSGAECLDYFRGFMDAVTVIPDICIDSEVTMGTLIRLYVSVMQINPKLMDARTVVGVYGTLKASYPCHK
jgi:hypothetical protein